MTKKFDSAYHVAAMHAAVFGVVEADSYTLDRISELRRDIRALLSDEAGSDQDKAGAMADLIKSWGGKESPENAALAAAAYAALQSAVSAETMKLRADGTAIWVSMQRKKQGEVVSVSIGAEPQSEAQKTAEEKRVKAAEKKEEAAAALEAAVSGSGLRAAMRAFTPVSIGEADGHVTLEQYAAAVVSQLPAAGSLVGLVLRLVADLDSTGRAQVAAACGPTATAKRAGRKATAAAVAGEKETETETAAA